MDAITLTSQATPHRTQVTKLCHLALLVVALAMTGCAGVGGGGGARTRITPPELDAADKRTTQRPGLVETLEITIEPPGPWVPNPSAHIVPYVPETKPEGPRRKAPGSRPEAGSEIRPTQDRATPLDDTLRAAIQAAAESGSRVTIRHSRSVDASQDESQSTLRDRGAGLDQRGSQNAARLDQRPRRLTLPWAQPGSAEASGGGYGLTAEVIGGTGINVLHLLGGLIAACCLIPILVPPRRLDAAAAIFGVGLLIIACGTVADAYPWVYAIVVVAVIGLIAYGAYQAWRSTRAERAIEPIATAIEKRADADAIKSDIADNAGEALPQVRAVVRAVKKRLVKRGAIEA